jgi:hypothetical protein
LEKNRIQKNSLLVVEFKTADESKKFVFENLKLLDLRRYGKTSFGFFLG